ncbi:beta-fructofuranosidase [Microthyrium microscopicum]|uniref:Beta-fructofuranosidase n=1 Tax=Microthyrium microscopicum TaxID=703497 RepID=A0A6A6U5C4_9PEZI|nr:beta-fructofuranosidase [Microthyrium microscopicum]
MKLTIAWTAVLALLPYVFCKTSTYVEPTVPTGTPIAGNYSGQLRPQIHFSPPKDFMNDPNGMFLDGNGTYHLYYQYNPTGTVAGNQHWGHATSTDLYTWINQPIALYPTDNQTFVFSGSAVVDTNNTSGFFPGQDNGVVAIYTLAHYNADGTAGPQTQNIAYSLDGGFTFIPYDKNPIIPSTSSQFRDPKVIWFEDHWVAVVSYAVEFTIGFYTSPNLRDWTHASNFTPHGLLGLQYECPNLVSMPIRDSSGTKTGSAWVFQISINPGAPLGGSIAEYFPGNFNGTHFTPYDPVARIADFGKDNYAGQFFYGIPEADDAISIAWASNWQYSQSVPTGPLEGWRSSMSLPRRNYLTNITRVGVVMASTPYDLSPVLGGVIASNSSLENGSLTVDYCKVSSNAVWLSINATGINSTLLTSMSTVNFTFSSATTNESVSGGFYFAADSHFFLDRGKTKGFENPFFTDKVSTTDIVGNSWSAEVVIDRSILEVFLDGGTRSATQTFFSNEPLTKLTRGGSSD